MDLMIHWQRFVALSAESPSCDTSRTTSNATYASFVVRRVSRLRPLEVQSTRSYP